MRVIEVSSSYKLDDLSPTDRPDPTEPGPHQVLVRMRAASLNYRDILVATGHDRWRPPVGRILGSDGVGEVIEVGSTVSRFRAGDRVMTTILPRWVNGPLTPEKRSGGTGGPAADGVLAERLVVDAEALVHVPQYLSAVEAATLPTAALTAWHAITRANTLRDDATILVGGTGGVSLAAAQIAAAAGARVIVTSSSSDKLDRVIELGAWQGVNYRSSPDWAKEVVGLTEGRGVDLAIDIGGATSLNDSIRATAMGGTVAVVGLVGGLVATIDLAEVFQRNLRLEGIETGSIEMLESMLDWFAEKRIMPVVDRVFAFDEAGEALRYLQAGQHVGKVCVSF